MIRIRDPSFYKWIWNQNPILLSKFLLTSFTVKKANTKISIESLPFYDQEGFNDISLIGNKNVLRFSKFFVHWFGVFSSDVSSNIYIWAMGKNEVIAEKTTIFYYNLFYAFHLIFANLSFLYLGKSKIFENIFFPHKYYFLQTFLFKKEIFF